MRNRPAIGSTKRARLLRANATDAERTLWRLLRDTFPESRFRRQVPIRRFIADFASHRARIVIEVDGGQHAPERDDERTRLIEAEGYRVLRFWNNDVLGNPEGVLTIIAKALNLKAPPLDGEGLGRGDASGKVAQASTAIPTQPSPIEEESSRAPASGAPPLDGEGLGRGDVSGKVAPVSTVTPTQPSPIEGEGSLASTRKAPSTQPLSREASFIHLLRPLAGPAARGFLDDAAVLELGGATLVLTHDMIVEGVHFLPSDPAGDVAWKLLAVNLSDLAGKGARPVGVLLGYPLGESAWDRAFAEGLGRALGTFQVPLLGGDTVAAPAGAPRSFGLTAIGQASGPVPSRAGGCAGDHLWVSGSIGDAGLGLQVAWGEREGPAALLERYRTPRPRLDAGIALAPIVSAMMDVSDGLLIDASRLAAASEVGIDLALDAVPLSEAFIEAAGEGLQVRLAAASAGDDYELLFAAAPERAPEILGISERLGLSLSRIGTLVEGAELALTHGGEKVLLPERLGWEHGSG